MQQKPRFRTVWRLVSGLLTSANAMLSTLAPEMLSLVSATGIYRVRKASKPK